MNRNDVFVLYNLIKYLIYIFDRHIIMFLNYFNRVIDMHRHHTRKKVRNTRLFIRLYPFVGINEGEEVCKHPYFPCGRERILISHFRNHDQNHRM